MKKIFFLFILLTTYLFSENLNYITAIKYKDFPENNFVRLVLFFVSPPPFFEIKKISDKKLKIILYNTDITKYVPVVKVESAILSEIIPKQVKSNVEVIFVFKRDILDFTSIKSDVPSLIYLKVKVSEKIEIEKVPEGNVSENVTGNVTAIIKKNKPALKKKIKTKPKPKPAVKPAPQKPKKIEIPKIEINRAKQIYEYGLMKMAEGDYSTAITTFNQILSQFSKDNPYYIKAQFRIADCYYKTMNEKDPHSIMNVVQIYFQLVSEYKDNPEASWGMFQMGNCYLKLGFYEEALASFKYVIKYAPKSIYIKTAKLNVGKILYRFKRFNEAMNYFKDIIKNYPDSVVSHEAYYKLGDCYVALKDFKSASKIYENAEKKWPEILNKMPETLYNIGDTYFHLGKYGKAREYFLKIRSLFPKTTYVDIALLKIGETYLKENNIENALYVYNRVVQIAKDKNNEIIARLRMAQIGLEYKISDDLKQKYGYLVNPEQGFLYIIKKFPQNKLVQVAYSKLVKYYLKIKNYKNAVFYLEDFFTKFPLSSISDLMKKNLKIALKGYINDLYNDDNFFKILVYYEKYKSDYFSKIDDYNEFLQIAMSMKNLFLIENSNKIFKGLLNIVPKKDKDFIEFNIIENNYLLGKSKLLKSINSFLKKYRDSKYKNNILFLKAEVYAKRRNFLKALQIYNILKDSDFKPFYINYKIAKLYENKGDFKNANKYFKKLISFPSPENDLDSAVPDIYFQKGYCEYVLKNYKKAIKDFIQFINKFPEDKRVAEAYFYSGLSYFKLNNYKKAKDLFNYITKNFSNTFWAKSANFYLKIINWIEKNEKEF